MKTQHTKGPWIVKGFTYIDYVNTNGRLQEIARVTEPASNSVKAQCEAFEVAKANARLIAAAPELLMALECAVGWLGKVIESGALKYCVGIGALESTNYPNMLDLINKARG